MKKFMKENYLNSNIKLNRFNGFLSVVFEWRLTKLLTLYVIIKNYSFF